MTTHNFRIRFPFKLSPLAPRTILTHKNTPAGRERSVGVTASDRVLPKGVAPREEDIKTYRESWSREQKNRIGAVQLFEVLQRNHPLEIGI